MESKYSRNYNERHKDYTFSYRGHFAMRLLPSSSTLSNPSDHLQVQQQRVMSASHGTAVRHVHHQGFPVDEKSLPSPFHRLMRTRAFLVFWVLFIIAYSTVPVVFLTAYVFIIGALGIVGHRKLRTFSDWSIRSWLCTLCVS